MLAIKTSWLLKITFLMRWSNVQLRVINMHLYRVCVCEHKKLTTLVSVFWWNLSELSQCVSNKKLSNLPTCSVYNIHISLEDSCSCTQFQHSTFLQWIYYSGTYVSWPLCKANVQTLYYYRALQVTCQWKYIIGKGETWFVSVVS